MRYMENEQHNQSKKHSELNLYISDITCVDKKLCCANYEQHGENPTGPKLPIKNKIFMLGNIHVDMSCM